MTVSPINLLSGLQVFLPYHTSVTKEVIKCIIEGARLARGGNQIGVIKSTSFDRLDMFETALPRIGCTPLGCTHPRGVGRHS